MPLSRRSVGSCQETSSHASRQGTLGHSRLSSLSHRGLLLAKVLKQCARANLHFKKKKRKWKMICRTFSQNPRTRGKSHQMEVM